MARKRILTVVVCVFFLTIGLATSTKQDGWRHRVDSVDFELRRLETRRDELEVTVDELERRCEELKGRISELENAGGDQDEE